RRAPGLVYVCRLLELCSRSLVCFFFSSRRRHTRSYGDWSSDVCSSDLRRECFTRYPDANRGGAGEWDNTSCWCTRTLCSGWWIRSEERRVGKECRCRWWAADEKKKKQKRGVRPAYTNGRGTHR